MENPLLPESPILVVPAVTASPTATLARVLQVHINGKGSIGMAHANYIGLVFVSIGGRRVGLASCGIYRQIGIALFDGNNDAIAHGEDFGA